MSSHDQILIGVIAGGLMLVALMTMIFIFINGARLRRALNDVDGFFAAMRGTENATSALARAVQEHVVGDRDKGNGKFVLSVPLASLRREYAEGEIAHRMSFWLGSLLTGLALICTFVLIAIVMTTDVSGAIRESSAAGDSGSGHLSDAVATLGVKFYISAAGIGGSVLALFCSNWVRAAIYRIAEHPSAELMVAFTSVDAQQLDAKIHELELMRGDRETRAEQHAEVCLHLAALHGGIEKLGSIEVSVKTIGNEVSAHLKDIMKEAMGEQLRGMFADTMAEVANIANSVQKNLTESFGKQLQTLAVGLEQGLAALKKSIEGQGQGQLEKILNQLQDTVSGGFQSESKKMAAALDSFASVVPALEQQLRNMTGKVADETRQRHEESAQMTQMVLGKVTSLVDTMTAQQAASANAIERMQLASEQGAEAMARRLETSGAGLISNVIGASRVEIEAIVAQLRAATDTNVDRHKNIEAQATHAAAAISEAYQGLERSASAIKDVAGHAAAMAVQAKASSDAIHGAAEHFVQAGNALLGSVNSSQRVIEVARVQTQEQQELLMLQRDYTKEVEKLWPELFNTYLDKFKACSDELARSWDSFHQQVSSVSNTVGAEFAENTAMLSEAVDRLVKINGGKVAPT